MKKLYSKKKKMKNKIYTLKDFTQEEFENI